MWRNNKYLTENRIKRLEKIEQILELATIKSMKPENEDILEYISALSNICEWDYAEKIARKIEDKETLIEALDIIATELIKIGNVEKGEEILLTIPEENSRVLMYPAISFTELASIFINRNNTQKAKDLLEKAEKLFLEIINPDDLEIAYFSDIAKLWIKIGDMEKAILIYEKAAKMIVDCNKRHFLEFGMVNSEAMRYLGFICHHLQELGEIHKANSLSSYINNINGMVCE